MQGLKELGALCLAVLRAIPTRLLAGYALLIFMVTIMLSVLNAPGFLYLVVVLVPCVLFTTLFALIAVRAKQEQGR